MGGRPELDVLDHKRIRLFVLFVSVSMEGPAIFSCAEAVFGQVHALQMNFTIYSDTAPSQALSYTLNMKRMLV